jgi:DNA-binding PadR family transcriptional regulator
MSSEKVARFLPLKPNHFHILLSCARGPVHGYGIRREVEERTGGTILISAGTLYETLQRLEDRGLIEETEAPGEGAEEASSRWRFYRTTGLGADVLAAELARLEADVQAARAQLAGS